MTAWKHLLLLLGILGVTALFSPMLEVKYRKVAVEFSARQLTFGFEREHSIIERELPALAEKHLPGSARSARDDARLVAQASRYAALAYAPAALLLLLGLTGLVRRRFGRFLGFLAFLFGLASIAAWVGLRRGIPLALAEADIEHLQLSLRFGAHLLLVVGAGGALAGLGALIKPDRGPRPAVPPRAAPPGPLPPGPPPSFPPPPAPPPVLPPPAA